MADTLYRTQAHVSGGRKEGHGRTADGKLDVDLDLPQEMGGKSAGTNPEQLFAVGYAACFLEAVKLSGRQRKQRIDEANVDSDVQLLKDDDGLRLAVTLLVHIPGLEREQVQEIVDAAHQVCPYSKATRGNVDVDVRVEETPLAA